MDRKKDCPKGRNNARYHSRRGFGTLEVVIIIAVLLTIAMLFRTTLSRYANDLMQTVFKDSIIEEVDDFPA
jgi:hypothetical protein